MHVARFEPANFGRVERLRIAIDAARTAHDAGAVRRLEWKLQVGLSVLFTLYAAAALAWGFAARRPTQAGIKCGRAKTGGIQT